MTVYLGDGFSVEPASTCSSAFYVACGCDALLGLNPVRDKETVPSDSIELLGAKVVLPPLILEASLPSSRRYTLSEGTKQIIPENRLPAEEDAKRMAF